MNSSGAAIRGIDEEIQSLKSALDKLGRVRAELAGEETIETMTRHPRAATLADTRQPKAAPRKPVTDRMPRRGAEQITACLVQIEGLLRSTPEGLRAEEIRMRLNFEAKELPRILKAGLKAKRLVKHGEKRATTYSLPEERPARAPRARKTAPEPVLDIDAGAEESTEETGDQDAAQ